MILKERLKVLAVGLSRWECFRPAVSASFPSQLFLADANNTSPSSEMVFLVLILLPTNVIYKQYSVNNPYAMKLGSWRGRLRK